MKPLLKNENSACGMRVLRRNGAGRAYRHATAVSRLTIMKTQNQPSSCVCFEFTAPFSGLAGLPVPAPAIVSLS
jgi:hypothetical protein